jgi:hypothetical protein
MITNGKIFETGTLGDLGNVATYDGLTGSAVDISHLESVLVTVKGSADLDATADMSLEYSQDGTNWCATESSTNYTDSAPSGSFTPTGRIRYIRGKASAVALGGFALRYAGWNLDQREARFGSLGTLDDVETGTAIDVSDLEDIIVCVGSNAAGVTAVECSYDGTDWINVTTFTNTTGSVLIPLPCKHIRCKRTTHSSGSAICSYGGHVAKGKLRFGTLGEFDAAETGDAVDVSDLDEVTVRAIFTNDGTFAVSATLVIEVSQDGDSWALAPGSSSLTSTGNLAITTPCKYLRARTSAWTIGSVSARYGGLNKDLPW